MKPTHAAFFTVDLPARMIAGESGLVSGSFAALRCWRPFAILALKAFSRKGRQQIAESAKEASNLYAAQGTGREKPSGGKISEVVIPQSGKPQVCGTAFYSYAEIFALIALVASNFAFPRCR
jgi:hypothetical protein